MTSGNGGTSRPEVFSGMHSKWNERAREEWNALVERRPDLDPKLRKAPMQPTKQIRVKSGSYRDRNVEISNPNGPSFNAYFDAQGVALVPLHLQPAVEYMMRWQPGRFTILPDEVVPPVPVAPMIQRIAPKDLPKAAPAPAPIVEPTEIGEDDFELDLSGVDLDKVSMEIPEELDVPKKRKGKTPKKPEKE